ncbi:OsmC family protein [Carnobacteriaceae bacterium zg-C25]|nr:OsmC family protein [Carnobacteriaceae bacterium zg-C25]
MSEKIVLQQGIKGFELSVQDAPNWVMLREVGYSPVQSMVASIGACGGYVYQELLRNSNVPFTFHRVELAYERHDDNVGALSKVTVTFVVSVEESVQAKASAIVKLVSRYCPVIQSLNPAIQLEEYVEFI